LEFVGWIAKKEMTGKPNVLWDARIKLYITVLVIDDGIDLDNIAKSILDGLEGVVYKNDKQVDMFSIARQLVKKEQECVEVKVETWT
jgi:crossover junction endodeoxyribonuclease RusA